MLGIYHVTLVLKLFKMTKEEKEYIIHTLKFALEKGSFSDNDLEHIYSAVNNSIITIENTETTIN